MLTSCPPAVVEKLGLLTFAFPVFAVGWFIVLLYITLANFAPVNNAVPSGLASLRPLAGATVSAKLDAWEPG